MRTKIVIYSLLFLFATLLFGLFHLQIISGRKLRELSDKNCIRLVPQPGARGKILDRNSKVIVDNQLRYELMVSAQGEQGLRKMLESIAETLGVTPETLESRYRSRYQARFIPVTISEDLDLKEAIALEEMKIDFPGIIIQARPVRYYPYAELASHLMGYLNEIDHWRLDKLADYGYKAGDIVGYTGLEEKYDYYLREKEGVLSTEVDSRGRFIRVLGLKPAQKGEDIKLTIDLEIQQILEEALEKRNGCAVVMDPADGKIFGSASSPSYDPGVFGGKSGSNFSGLFKDPDFPMINRVISSAYPAASVFKLSVATGALETKKITPWTSFECSGGLQVGKRRFKCWDTHQKQNLFGGIAKSCDVYFYRTGLLLGGTAIANYAAKLGLSKISGIDLPYEVSGFLPSPEWKRRSRSQSWYDGDTANFSIGQGEVLVTPIQITRMAAVFANGGFLVKPYIVKAIGNKDISSYQKRRQRLGLKKDTLQAVRKGMKMAASEGTAKLLANLTVPVAGKTGTAQVSGKKSHAWFAGFFPYAKPKYVICIFLEHGVSGNYATVTAKKVIEEMLNEGLI